MTDENPLGPGPGDDRDDDGEEGDDEYVPGAPGGFGGFGLDPDFLLGGSDNIMGLVRDMVLPMAANVLGSNTRSVLLGANVALEAVFRVIASAYEADAEETQAILTSDARAMEKVSKLNDLIIDGSEESGEGDE